MSANPLNSNKPALQQPDSTGDQLPASGGAEIRIDPFDLQKVAMLSSARAVAQEHIFAIDTAMRANYDLLRAKVVMSIRPVIVVQFDFSGGTYNLLTNDRQITVQPVPRTFEQIKSICHAPLGIYTILAPYLNGPASLEWIKPLDDFRIVLARGLETLKATDLDPQVTAWCSTVLANSIKYIEASIRDKLFSVTTFQDYSKSVFEAIRLNMIHAAKIQVTAIVKLLLQWKKELGAEWENLYTVILTTWTIEEENQHWLVFRELMERSKLEQRLYVVSVGNASHNTVDVALMNLAIIVQDKIAGHLVFAHHSAAATTMNVNLASRSDLLSGSVRQVLKEILAAYNG